MTRVLPLLLVLLLTHPASTLAAGVTGELRLSAGGRSLLPQAAQEAVVYFRPDDAPRSGLQAGSFEMRTVAKRFEPDILVVTVGSRVAFPNGDPILHNVFSLSGRNGFDLGLLPRGPGGAHTFQRPGLVRVFCNVHHQMSGHILVLDTPHVARPDASGRFALEVPAGARGELFVWHPRADLWRHRLDASTAPGHLRIAMALTRPRVPPHTNKLGRSYGQAGSYAN